MHSPSGLPRIKALPRTLFDFAAGAVTLVLFAFAAAVLWLRYAALPDIDRYRGDILSSIEKASGMAVSARHIHGGWEGLRPHVYLDGFRIEDKNGRLALGLERAEFTLSWWALLVGEVRFHDVDFHRPELCRRFLEREHEICSLTDDQLDILRCRCVTQRTDGHRIPARRESKNTELTRCRRPRIARLVRRRVGYRDRRRWNRFA